MRRLSLARRVVAAIVGVGVLVGATGVVAEVAAALDVPDWFEDLERFSSEDEPELAPLPEPTNAPEVTSQGTEPASAQLPAADEQVVTLGDAGEAVELTIEGEVSLAPATAEVAGSQLEVEVLGQDVAERAGVSGFVFTLAGSEASLGELGAGGLPAELSVDYTDFEHAFGAGLK